MNLVIYITNKCNLNCTYCFVEKGKEVINLETYTKIFDKYKDKISNITFFGGEPLLYFELIKEIIEYNQKNNYNYNYIINTNGTIINNNIIEFCKKYKILFNISLDGNMKSNCKNRFSEEIFNVVVNNIKTIKKQGIQVIINYVITPNNINHIYESLEYFWNKDFFDICFMINYDEIWTPKDIVSMKEQLEKAIEIIIKPKNEKFMKIYPIYNKINYIVEEKRSKKCNFGKESLIIYCDGKQYPCMSFVQNPKYEITEDKQIFTNICDIEKCKECEYETICDNNCMCKFCYHNKNSLIDVNCECEKIFIEIAKKVLYKILNHELI